MTETPAAGVVREAVAQLRDGDFAAFREYLHPEVDWTTTGVFLEGGTFHGPDAVSGYLERFAGGFTEIAVLAREVTEVGDAVVVSVVVRGSGALSGLPSELELHTVIELDEGLIRRARNYVDRDAALRAAAAGAELT